VSELAFTFPPEVVEAIAQRAAELVLEQLAARQPRPEQTSPNATVPEAAAYLAAKPQRIYDLCSQGRLTRIKDGGRTLIAWAELEAYLAGQPTGPFGAELTAIAQALPTPYRDGFASAIRG
jgi:excisionase family DNA binding protein